MRHHPAELIRIKRDGGALDDDHIEDIVSGVVDGSLGPEQLGAFLMAVCCRGMTVAETAKLTLAMRDSGRVLDLRSIAGMKVDKHSTGGVGDKVSLLLAPLVAACGVPVPMISGRGLGHTGGTLDKLAAIPGYRIDLEPDEFVSTLAECGFVMAGASREIAPADRRMYAARDISGTIESVPLITSSILSKKLAEGIDGLVLDVKFGRAAFMRRREDAVALAESLVSTARAAGTPTTALLTDMDTPLGRAVGNSVELVEVVDALRGRGPRDLLQLTFALGAEMLVLAGRHARAEDAITELTGRIEDGSARAAFARNIECQGGDPSFLDEPSQLGCAPCVVTVPSPASGHVVDIDPLIIGLAAMDLGAGRRQPTDDVDPLVGIVLAVDRGDAVETGTSLAEIHARSALDADRVLAQLADAIHIGDRPPVARELIVDRRD